MNSKKTISITEARKRIFDIAEEVQNPGIYYTLTENGKPKAVILSYEEYDSLMENLEILSDPKVLAKIKKAEEEFERGDYITLDELAKEIHYDAKKEWVLQEKTKKQNKYKVNSKRK